MTQEEEAEKDEYFIWTVEAFSIVTTKNSERTANSIRI